MSRTQPRTPPNQALQRTAPGVTACALAASLYSPPATFPHRLRRPSQSLSLGSLGVLARMEKNSVLISLLIALAAIVALATKVMEFMSVRVKYKSDAPTPTNSTSASAPIQRSSTRWSRMSTFDRCMAIFNFVAFSVSMLTLLALIFWAPTSPASSRDVVLVGLLVCIVVLSSRNPNS